MTFSKGATYEGSWKNGLMDGYGIYKWTDGSEFKGTYVYGIKEGYGEMKWKNGI